MNALNLVIEQGIESAVEKIMSELKFENYPQAHAVIAKEFNECNNIEVLTKFSVIMIDHNNIVDVEPKMIELMGEDEFFDLVD